MPKFTPRRQAAGFTLIEILVVLVIGLLITVAAAASFGRVFASNDTSNESRNVHAMMAAGHSLRGPGGYPADLMPILRSNGDLPSYGTDNGGYSTHAWGGVVSAVGSTSSFQVSYASVPKQPCVSFAPKVADAKGVTVTINGTDMSTTSADSLTTQAEQLCLTSSRGSLIQFRPSGAGVP